MTAVALGVPGRVAAVVEGMRPKQWVKSVLVLAAPASADVILERHVLERTVVAVVTFTLVAAGQYLVNDARDVEADRLHPTKRFRVVAAGAVPVPVAWTVGLATMAAGVLGGFAFANWKLGVVLIGYVALTLAYSLKLKQVAIVELLGVAVGFLLRPIAGAVASDVPLSQWFLIVAGAGSLFMVACKRSADITELGLEGAAKTRPVLLEYTPEFLRQVQDLTMAVTVLAYCLFAFERVGSGHAFYQASIVPVTYGLLRYALLVGRGEGGAPEDVVLGDRPLQLAGLAWAVLFGMGVVRG